MPDYSKLSDEDRKILEEAHKNSGPNPPLESPAHPDNPKHHRFIGALNGISQKLGNAVIFGAGATLGSDAVNSLLGR